VKELGYWSVTQKNSSFLFAVTVLDPTSLSLSLRSSERIQHNVVILCNESPVINRRSSSSVEDNENGLHSDGGEMSDYRTESTKWTYVGDVSSRRSSAVAERSTLHQIILGRMKAENMEEIMRVHTTVSEGDVWSEF
jgi:hypothetical protein